MKKITILCILLSISSLTAQESIINVGGNPTCGSSVSSFAPAKYNGFTGNSSWSAIIYSASDINYTEQGTITDIAFIADCKSSACSFDTASNQKIFMALTTSNTFISTNKPDTSTMTEVFNGDITWLRGTGSPFDWTEINLSTSLSYDGTSNIIIYFENNFDDVLGGFFGCGESPSYLVNNLGDDRVLYAYNFSGTPPSTGSLSNQTPLLKLTIDNSTLSLNETTNSVTSIYVNQDLKRLEVSNLQSKKELYLYSISGKLLYNQNLTNLRTESLIDLSSFSTGIYIIKLIDSDKVNNNIVKKFVIDN